MFRFFVFLSCCFVLCTGFEEDPRCKENEVWSDCKTSCPPEICAALVIRIRCDPSEKCDRGCVCKPGYLRKDYNSTCIPICDCPEMAESRDCKEFISVACRLPKY